jgi:anaerobic magnesium-protoporphyrin IX monomethyl ester cyclase
MDNRRLALVDMNSIRATSVRYLASYVKSQGFPAKVLFALMREENLLPEVLVPPEARGTKARLTAGQMSRLLAFLQEHAITHLGFSLMTGNFRAFQETVQYLRREGWKGCIIAGGVHPTVRPDESLCEGVDYVVTGPGERPLIAILQDRDPEEIGGLVYRRDGRIARNPITDDAYLELESLPFPDYDFEDHYWIRDGATIPFDAALYRKLSQWAGTYYYLTTGRGCPYRCRYCCNVNRQHLSRASVNRVMEELHWAKAKMPFLRGCNTEGDDTFFMGSEQWLQEFCTRFKAELGWPFIAQIMPRLCTPQRLQILKNGGLKYTIIGLQGSERMNRELYGRNETNDSFVKACDMMADVGITYSVDVILDSPYETEDDLRDIARTLNRLRRPFRVRAFSMTPFPGTALYEQALNDGLLEKFACEAYELVSFYNSQVVNVRPNVYRTPAYWCKLIETILPLYRSPTIDRLIDAGPDDPRAVRAVERLYRKASFRMVFAERLRSKAPKVFESAVNVYVWWRRWRMG